MFDENNLIELLELEIHNCEKQGHSYIGMDLAAAKQIMELLKQRKTDWIPVDERLPEEQGEYLVTYHPCYRDDMARQSCDVGIDIFRRKTGWANSKFQKVIAWMPFPERYEDK